MHGKTHSVIIKNGKGMNELKRKGRGPGRAKGIMNKSMGMYEQYLNKTLLPEDVAYMIRNREFGQHITKQRLQDHSTRLGSLMRKYDPIGFNLQYEVWVPEVNPDI